MAGVVDTKAKEYGIKCISDFGSGYGYLSQFLALELGHFVISVDGKDSQIVGAQKREKEILKMGCTFEKFENDRPRIQNIECLISSSTSLEVLEDALKKLGCHENQTMMCGLHTCGDFASHLLRMYTESQCKAIINVGCCYNNLTEEGFPMSQFLQQRKTTLNEQQKVLATQALKRWFSQTETEDVSSYLKLHYRAILQVVLHEKKELPKNEDKLSVGHIPKKFYDSFVDYAQEALKRLGKDGIATNEELLNFEKRYRDRQGLFSVCWALRSMSSPLIEMLILFDRVLYLCEKGKKVYLFPIFDPFESPRNMALLAI